MSGATMYDLLDKAGHFRYNPANRDARDKDGHSLYAGPVKFPMMLYHPKGETKIIKKSEVVATLLGPKEVGEQRELVSRIVNDEEEYQAAIAEGWHVRPALALQQSHEGVYPIPPMGPEDELELARREIAGLRQQLQDAKEA